MEEAVAVNKRLKEALDRQKQSNMKRNAKGVVKTGAIQQYIEQELEVHLSIVEAEKSLNELMEYRAWVTEQIAILKNSPDDEANREKLAELENDLALRKAQISDLQQKMLIADQENKTRTQWDNIQTMIEAKAALKCLFELLVDTKKELQNKSEKGYQSRYEEVKEKYDRLVVEFESRKTELEAQLVKVKQQCEEKVSFLLALQRGVTVRGEKNEACKQLQAVIQYQQDRLEQLEIENKKLSDELEELQSFYANAKRQKKQHVYPVTDEEDVDSEKDPDWVATPLFKRIQAQRSRLKMNWSVNDADTARATKRNYEGVPHCTCRGSCSTKICGCVKTGVGCGVACRCQHALCKNRNNAPQHDDKENHHQQSSPENNDMNVTPPSYFDDRDNLEATYIKKKKCFFFPDEQANETNKGD
ncbi:Chromosome-associated kinesin KIF4A [Papilio xuthus]|uniref:Chromosome-associated kinesin KIF4A n=1 Tax=Papilio xuthus TaxID=66420 RepID=A0A194QDB9_PAPXU|nr:Chromosome-associated kinesin KIF4A [Papilio xuthus]